MRRPLALVAAAVGGVAGLVGMRRRAGHGDAALERLAADEVKRRLDASHRRLKATIEPPPE